MNAYQNSSLVYGINFQLQKFPERNHIQRFMSYFVGVMQATCYLHSYFLLHRVQSVRRFCKILRSLFSIPTYSRAQFFANFKMKIPENVSKEYYLLQVSHGSCKFYLFFKFLQLDACLHLHDILKSYVNSIYEMGVSGLSQRER